MASSHSALPGFSTYLQSISVLLLIGILFLAGVHSQNQSSDAAVLLRFKTDYSRTVWTSTPGSTGGRGWINWHETDENPCAWNGVTCTYNSTVLALDLSSWANGESLLYIDVSVLGNFPDLRQLDLSKNLLITLDGITSLRGLVRLDLSSNNFDTFPGYNSGQEPIGICNMSKLTWFDISSNFIHGPLPSCFSRTRSLQYLSFQQNNFSGEVPSLGALVNLQFLYLADNQLSGPFPKGLSGLSNILIVDLSNNLLSGTIPAFPNSTNLVQLSLDNNNLASFDEPWFVGADSSPSILSISSNQLTGVIPSRILNMLNLQYLNFSSNQLRGPVPMGFGSLPLFSSLDLSYNLVVGKIPSDVLSLWASNNTLIDCAALDLSHNRLYDTIPDYDGLQCFGNLDLSYNDLSGAIPPNVFSNSVNIFRLSFKNNRLSGDVIDRLDQNNGIVSDGYAGGYDLQNNLLTGDLTRLANGARNNTLEPINLSNNSLRWSTSEAIPDPISATLDNWRNLYLFLGGNDFSGTPVPTTCLGNPFSVRVLDLSKTHLKGEILGSAFHSSCFPELGVLNLSGNDITGSVPGDIFMPNLKALDLSHNKLSGPLPTISPNSIFYNPDIFSGNVGLCGPPLDACPQAVSGATGLHWWELFLIIGGALIIATGSCLAATWRWRVYQRRHQQDADLINTLLERDSATLMSLRELKSATDNFAASAQIGEGGFGTVYAGILNDGTKVAIKRSKREGLDKDKQQFLNEVRILSQVNHRNLVKLLGCCMENKTAVLVFEFVSNGTLQDHLHGKFGSDHLTWEQHLNIALQTANTATTFPVYHRDVKSANILLDEELNAKVSDFGISKLAPSQVTQVSTVAIQGTMGYIDPEYYTSYRLTDKSDVFSFGVVLLELISSKLALDLSRNGDDSSLVNLASPHITRGELQEFIDPALLETYNDRGGHVPESILKGRTRAGVYLEGWKIGNELCKHVVKM